MRNLSFFDRVLSLIIFNFSIIYVFIIGRTFENKVGEFSGKNNIIFEVFEVSYFYEKKFKDILINITK